VGSRKQEDDRLTREVVRLFGKAIDASGYTRADVARRLGRHRSFLTEFLRHGRHMTVANLSSVAWALGARVGLWLEAIPVVVPKATKRSRGSGKGQ